jgi:hypothetical protein
VPKSQSGNS